MQVVECRRILKWTYTYGYYTFGEQADLPSNSPVSRIPPARLKQYLEFFEYSQVGLARPLVASSIAPAEFTVHDWHAQ